MSMEASTTSPKDPAWRKLALRVASAQTLMLLTLLGLVSCQSFKVDLQSPEPIKVDVNMRLNVYQYKGDEPDKPNEEQARYDEAQTRMRNRYAEIQTLKNNGFVGEDHRGLLHLREKPPGEWGDYVEKEVNAENEDRTILIRRLARDNNRAMHEEQEQQWKLRTSKAYHGEWIEVPGDKPNTFKWVQSDGPRRVPTSDTASGNPTDSKQPSGG